MRSLPIVVVVVTLGCAPSLSTFQPAHVAPKGHAQVSAGFEVGVPVGAIVTAIQTGKDLSSRAEMGETLTTDQKWSIFDAGVNLLLSGATVGPHFSIAYTLVDRLELNVRYAGSAWRFGGRYQVLDHRRGPMDMTIGLGVSRYSYEFPISDQIPVLKLEDFSRWQVDVPILIGTSGDYFRVWVGPKILLTKFETQLTLTLPSETTVARFEGTAAYLGGQAGAALGYKHFFLACELTLAEGMGTAHLSAEGLGAHDMNISTFVVFPSCGVMLEI